MLKQRFAGDVHRRGNTAISRDAEIRTFRAEVWSFWKKNGRHDLPWRKTKDPYKILVSEVMLQQTQVPRVIEKYKEFLHEFPTVQELAKAPLSRVLKIWSGLGYNRRGKYLRDAAIQIVKNHEGKIPPDAVSLQSLPGIGPYTASAVLIFAFNMPDTMIETNIRAAFIHHFFNSKVDIPKSPQGLTSVNKSPQGLTSVKKGDKCQGQTLGDSAESRRAMSFEARSIYRKAIVSVQRKVTDRDLLPFITAAAEGQDPRTWHWALMDYGSHLKKLLENPSRLSAHHVKQSKFEGSLRQVRGAILRALQSGEKTEQQLRLLACDQVSIKSDTEKYETALDGLEKDGMIIKWKGRWNIA